MEKLNGNTLRIVCQCGCMWEANLLYECEVSDHRRQAIYGQAKLSPEEQSKHLIKELYNYYREEKCFSSCHYVIRKKWTNQTVPKKREKSTL